MPKHNNIEKHMGKRKVDHDIPSKGLKKNEIYYDYNNKYVQNLAFFNVLQTFSILQQVGNVTARENQRKIVQFPTLFHVLENGQPMVEYEYLKHLFENLPKKHCPLMFWGG